jgi:hypothetical protein
VVARLQNLIAQMDAEIGGSSPTARRPAGNVDNPRDLYPMVENKTRPQSGKTQSAKPQAAKPMSPEQLKGLPIGATVGASQAPQVAGKAFSISCRVKTDQPDAMILAHGGAIAGYAIFIHDGYISFLVRTGAGGEFIQVVSPEAYRGEANILAELAADGRLMLRVGEDRVFSKYASLIKRQPQEDFCVGHDNANAVTPKADYPALKGTLSELEINIK